MTAAAPEPERPRRLPRNGLPLPPGKSYPPVQPDEELFASEYERQLLMKTYGLDEKQVRMARASAWI